MEVILSDLVFEVHPDQSGTDVEPEKMVWPGFGSSQECFNVSLMTGSINLSYQNFALLYVQRILISC